MNILTKTEITQLVETDYQKALKQIEEKRVLGTFLIGPAYQTVTSFFPTIQDIAINCAPMDCWFEKSDFGGNRVIDFRLVSDLVCSDLEFIVNIFCTDTYIINPMYQKQMLKIRTELSKNLLGSKSWMEGNTINIFAEGWTKLFDHYLQFRDGVQDKIFKSLTKTEEKALIYTLEEIGDEGILSISKAINDSGISRPVFTSMLDKLDRYKGAEVKNMGVKGTYINFYDHILSKFEIT